MSSKLAYDVEQTQGRHHHRCHTLALCGLSLADCFLFYATNILLARHLSGREFDDYTVAVSTVMLLSALATLGLEKYALLCLPVLRTRRDWPRSHGFWVFARRVAVGLGLTIAILLAVFLEAALAFRGADYHIAIVITAAFLPMIALFLTAVEVTAAYGGQLGAVTCYRLLMPATILGLNLFTVTSYNGASAISAAVCYGLGWTFSLLVLSRYLGQVAPSDIWRAPLIIDGREWIRGAVRLLWMSLMLNSMARSGVIILELMRPDIGASTYAVAFQTGTFMVFLATSTNRFYLPRISAYLDVDDYVSLRKWVRGRLALIGPLATIVLAVTTSFGRPILSLFGPHFVHGYPALCIVVAGAGVSTLFSVSPFLLQYSGRGQLVNRAMLVAVIVQIAICFPLSYRLGATGTAISYSVPATCLFLFLHIVATRHVRARLK